MRTTRVFRESIHPAVRPSAASIVAVVLALGVAAVSLAANPNPGVLPPNSNAQGHGLAGWSAEWSKWLISIPNPVNPLFDTTGENCGQGQSGHVFFLASNFVTTDTIPCHVPTGKAIFFGITTVECSTVEAPPFFGATEEALRDCAKCWADLIVPSSLEVTLDGRELQQLSRYRAASPLYTFEYPADNIFGIPGGPATGDSVADGYYIYLNPLSAGTHSLSFSGMFDLPTGNECGLGNGSPVSFGFAGSYELIVEGGN